MSFHHLISKVRTVTLCWKLCNMGWLAEDYGGYGMNVNEKRRCSVIQYTNTR